MLTPTLHNTNSSFMSQPIMCLASLKVELNPAGSFVACRKNMDSQENPTLNDLQEIFEAIRKDSEKTNLSEGVAQEIEDARALIEQSMEANARLALLREHIIQDDVTELERQMQALDVAVSDPVGALKITLVHLAAYFSSLKILRFLSTLSGFDVNAKTKVGDTPLMFALYSAQTDFSILNIIRLLLSGTEPCDCSINNNNALFPLCVAVKNGYTECANFLSVPPLLVQYKPEDLLYVIKLALTNGQENLVDTMWTNLNEEFANAVLSEIRLLPSLSGALIETVKFVQRTPIPAVRQPKDASDDTEIANEDLLCSFISNACTSIAEDAGGRRLKPGDVVKTLSQQIVKRALPSSASDEIVGKVASSMAIIHDIPANDKIYAEIAAKNCIANIRSFGAVFYKEGPSIVIADGSTARVGSFVQVCSSVQRLKGILGESGWVHGMEDTCGRTGKIIRLTKNSDILVQFGWHVRYYFKPSTLLQSSPDKVESKDKKTNKWITAGNLANINMFTAAFKESQKKNGLPLEGDYALLAMKFVVIKRFYIKAFASQKNVQVTRNGKDYLIHADCIELVESIKDRSGTVVHLGDKVRIEDKNTLVASQKAEFGGWVNSLEGCVKQVGILVQIRPALGDSNGLIAKVEFDGSKTFYFSPRALRSAKDEDFEELPKAKVGPTLSSISVPEDLERVNRDDIICLNKLGEGGFGCVYKGTWTKNGEKRVVAIKQIKDAATSSISFSMLMQEARTQYTLSQHPNIVSLFGISYIRDLWMVLEFVDGASLFEILFPERGKPVDLPFKRKVKLCLDMCNAISFVHSKGYLHCDIKPHNMMVERKTDRLFILDFGITRFLGNMSLHDFATQYTNSVSGTLYYIPPECLQPDQDGRYRRPKFSADIWALGAVFFELFTGSHLSKNSMEFLHDKMMNTDAKVKTSLAKLPHLVASIVSRALEFDQAKRPVAQELVEFYHELLSAYN